MSEWIEIKAEGGSFKAFLARPVDKALGAVVVIQEIFGVNEAMRQKCQWLARQGFIALCPDLFWRLKAGVDLSDKTQAEWDQAFDYMKRFDLVKGIGDIRATIARARGLGAERVGALGYCLGGLLAYLTACRTDVDASVGYYGVNMPNYAGEASNITSPLLLHIAGQDEYVAAPEQARIRAEIGAHTKVSLHFYPEQNHAFAREGAKHYDGRAARLADARTLSFLEQALA